MHGWVVLFLWRLTLPVLVFCLVGLCISKWELYTTVAISNIQRILLNIYDGFRSSLWEIELQSVADI